MALQRPEDRRARGAREAGPEEERQPGRRLLQEEQTARSEAAPCRGPRRQARPGGTAGCTGRFSRRPAGTPQLTQGGRSASDPPVTA